MSENGIGVNRMNAVDLINREHLLRNMRDWQMEYADIDHEREYNFLELIIKGIENEPIAYNVEKVIEQMKSKSREMSTIKIPHKYYKAIGTRICEDIIREGGVE